MPDQIKRVGEKPIIVPIAGGKGGVGKSFLAANLAVALAEMGHRTVVIDLDLGASNLHSFLGLPNEHPGIGDFLRARTAELSDMLVDTTVPNLSFVPGEGRTPFLANIPHAQKLRLISRIKKLRADYVLLDLAAGTTYNTLDFFRLSPRGLLVTVPEYPAIMNMMTFLKNLLLRLLGRSFAKDMRIRALLVSVGKRPIGQTQTTIAELRDEIASIDPAAGDRVAALCREYRPRVLFNLGEHPDEITIAEQIDRGLEDILSLQVDYFGFVFRDPAVRQSVRTRTAPFLHYSDSPTARNVRQIAERIANFWDKSPNDSHQLILRHARDEYESSLEAPAQPVAE